MVSELIYILESLYSSLDGLGIARPLEAHGPKTVITHESAEDHLRGFSS